MSTINNRKFLIAKRNGDSEYASKRAGSASANDTTRKSQKRKHEESPEKQLFRTVVTPTSKDERKFSANDRLKQYRKCLEEKKYQIIKVHQANNAALHKSMTAMEPSIATKLNEARSKVKLQLNNSHPLDHRSILKKNRRSSHRSTKGYEPCTSTPSKAVINDCSTRNNDNSFKLCENSIVGVINEEMEMDWSPLEESDIISDIQKIRESVNIRTYSAPKQGAPDPKKVEPNIVINNCKILYIVIDTNLFISNLSIIRDILQIEGNLKKVVYVPWMVIQELDYMKDGRSGTKSTQHFASKAIKFINEQLILKSSDFVGQKVQDAARQSFPSSTADDDILNCCLQIIEKGAKCILLSNDVNLRNKGIINGLQTFGSSESLSEISNLVKDTSSETIKAEKVMSSISKLCSFIIMKQMKKAYGDVWNKMKLMKEPPWNLMECLERIKHYWSSVYRDDLQKQTMKTVDDLRSFLSANKWIREKHLLHSLVDLCLSLCIYLRNGYPPYSENITLCMKNIQNTCN